MKFVRTVGYTKWDHEIREDNLTELKSKPVRDFIKHWQGNWRSRMNRMNVGRFPKAILRYRPKGVKINRTSDEEMEGKCKIEIGPKAYHLLECARKRRFTT
jgi:hypothetical protein